MANKWKIVQGTIASGDGATKDFVFSGFGTPDAVLVVTTADVTGLSEEGASGNANGSISIGMSDGSKTRVFSMMDEDAQATMDTYALANNNGDIIHLMDGTGAEDVAYSFNSFIADGIRLNADNKPGGTVSISVMLIQADNVEVVDVDNTGGDLVVTSLAYQPNLLIGAGCDVAYSATASADGRIFYGFATDNGAGTDQCGMFIWRDSGVTSADPWHYTSSTLMARASSDTGAYDGGWDVTAWSATGFTVDRVLAGGTDNGLQGAVLAIDTGTVGVWIGTVDIPTTVTTKAYTGPSFTPQFISVLATRNTSALWDTRDGSGNAGTHCIGFAHAATTAGQCSHHIRTDDGAGTSISKNDMTDSVIYLPKDTGSISSGNLLAADLQSFDSGAGFTLDHTAVSSTARHWGFLAIEEEADAGQTVSPASISSTEAFGTAALTAIMNLTLASLPSAEAFGAPAFSLDLVFPSIAPAEAFGVAQFDLSIVLPSMASLEAFGTLALSVDLTFPSIGSDEGFGTLVLSQGGLISPASIAPAEAFGTAQFDIDVNFSGISSAEGLGLPVFSGGLLISPASIPSEEALGTAQFDIDITFPGIASAEVVPSPLIDASVTIPSISGEEAFGTPVIVAEHALSGLGNIGSGEAFGTATFTGGLDPVTGRSIFLDIIVPFHGSLDVECAEFAAGIDIILPGEDVT